MHYINLRCSFSWYDSVALLPESLYLKVWCSKKRWIKSTSFLSGNEDYADRSEKKASPEPELLVLGVSCTSFCFTPKFSRHLFHSVVATFSSRISIFETFFSVSFKCDLSCQSVGLVHRWPSTTVAVACCVLWYGTCGPVVGIVAPLR